ncbi:Transposon Ty3-I Gag-Pol polyprotein [Vitis vinifera]|uniref:Transposon Ty3-I Gag-Pol polyprotein n=1 Tax=Vitis vinifera TaxID=29760 RepID=A0A438GNG0_VITVI|nr:Transposon Ty3-I Gag-Pol polyprotein [Vitis vinifera]
MLRLSQRIDSVESTLNKRMDGMQNDLSQKIDNLQYSISRLTNLNTVQEKGRFPSQPHQNPKGIHEVEIHEGESSQVKDVKALITLRSGKKIEKPTPKPHVEEEEETKKREVMKGKKKDVSEMKEDHDSTVNTNSEKILLKEEMLEKPTFPPFPQALHGKKGDKKMHQKSLNECHHTIQVSFQVQSPGCPTISVMIGGKVVEKALLDLGASVNLLPYSVYKQLGLGELKPTSITLSLADRSVKIPKGLIQFLSSLEGHSLLPSNAIINCRNGLMQLTFGNMTLELNIFYMSKKQITSEEEEEGLSEPPDVLATLQSWKRREEILHLFNKEEGEAAEEETPKLNFKPLPVELKYTYLEENNQCPVVISSSLTSHQEKCLLEGLKRCKKAIGWQISDLKGINPLVCTHHIFMEEEAKPIRQPQRRLNPHLQEVVRIEVLKLLQAGIIYPISNSPWVSPTQVVPKKLGITVVQNEKGEEIATRLTSGWRVCIDYRKLNAVTRKDHFPLPFIDQVLERVSGHPFYCFLDGYSRRMPFGLCNAPATFQRCMLSIFSDMVDRIMEVFMDDITVYGGIVLGHIISEKGIEVDKAKVEIIAKLPSPTTVKEELYLAKEKMGSLRDLLCKQNIERSSKELHNYRERIVSCGVALDKFRAYLVGFFIIVFTDHSALKDKKGVENVVADHLSRLAIAHNSHVLPINDNFPEESLMLIEKAPDQIIRKCVPEEEQQGILSHCHENACGGHFASQKTAMKVLQSGFTWPSLFKIPTSCVGVVIDAKDSGSLQKETKCP